LQTAYSNEKSGAVDRFEYAPGRGRPDATIIGGLTMRKEKEGSAQLDRRRLLKGAGLAIGAAGVTSAAAAKSGIAAKDETKPQQSGYRETEHVQTYYRLARQ
jgi:hypothetical protein